MTAKIKIVNGVQIQNIRECCSSSRLRPDWGHTTGMSAIDDESQKRKKKENTN